MIRKTALAASNPLLVFVKNHVPSENTEIKVIQRKINGIRKLSGGMNKKIINQTTPENIARKRMGKRFFLLAFAIILSF